MKIAFVGNSHLVAYKNAEAQIKARFPSADLSFFTLHNRDFFRNAVKNRGGLRYIAPETEGGRARIDQQGEGTLQFQEFDHVFLVSHGFYLGQLLEVMATYDILDLEPAGRGALISWPCVQQATHARLRYYTRRLKDFFPLQSNVTIVQTPFPAEQALRTHPHLAGALEQPQAGFIFESYNDLIREHLAPLDAQFQGCPEALLDGPFVTKAAYARAQEIEDAGDVTDADHTHMNAGYAMQMVEALLG